MIARILTLSLLGLLAAPFAGWAQPAPSAPQAPPPPSAPKIRRWLDVQQLHLSSRFRWYESSEGVVRSSNLQYQPLVRARFLFDAKAKYSVQVHAASGATLVSGWNNTGGGLGEFAGTFSVKQFYFNAEPVKGLEFQVGSLYMNRGEVTENISYDNDTYVTGERATWRPAEGRLTQLSVITGYYGEYREPNFFNRADRLGDWNYGQVLAGFRVASRVQASVDYTYEDGRDILREAVTFRMPEKTKVLTSIKAESYQRFENGNGLLLNKAGAGFNVAGDLRIQKLTVTTGVMSVDRYYGPYNGDRYEVGTRFYYYGTYPVTRDFSVGWFHGEAFATDYPIPNKHRFEIIATINPTASLKRAGIF